jgi:hypothetical protein
MQSTFKPLRLDAGLTFPGDGVAFACQLDSSPHDARKMSDRRFFEPSAIDSRIDLQLVVVLQMLVTSRGEWEWKGLRSHILVHSP